MADEVLLNESDSGCIDEFTGEDNPRNSSDPMHGSTEKSQDPNAKSFPQPGEETGYGDLSSPEDGPIPEGDTDAKGFSTETEEPEISPENKPKEVEAGRCEADGKDTGKSEDITKDVEPEPPIKTEEGADPTNEGDTDAKEFSTETEEPEISPENKPKEVEAGRCEADGTLLEKDTGKSEDRAKGEDITKDVEPDPPIKTEEGADPTDGPVSSHPHTDPGVSRSATHDVKSPKVVFNDKDSPQSSSTLSPPNTTPTSSGSDTTSDSTGSTSSDALADSAGQSKPDRLPPSVNSGNLAESVPKSAVDSGSQENQLSAEIGSLAESVPKSAVDNGSQENQPSAAEIGSLAESVPKSAVDNGSQENQSSAAEIGSLNENAANNEPVSGNNGDNAPELHQRKVKGYLDETISEESESKEDVEDVPPNRCRNIYKLLVFVVLVLAAIFGIQFVLYVDEIESPEILPAEVDLLSVQELQANEVKPELKILVVGKHGIGKRTLVTELFGEGQECLNDDEVSSSSAMCNKFGVNGVSIQVILLDSAPNLNCRHFRNHDLVIFAMRMDDTRYRGDDEEILEWLSRMCGTTLWNNGMVVLTFANKVTYVDDTGREQRSKDHLMKKAKHWKNSIHGTLRSEGVTQAILSDVPTVPVGHPSKLQLYDNTESWKTALIKCMIVRLKMSGMEASAAMWQVMKDNIRLQKGESTIRCEW